MTDLGINKSPENKPTQPPATLKELEVSAGGHDYRAAERAAQKPEIVLLDTVGLFGTCGDSRWREEPMKRFEQSGIKYFNPVVPNWTPECAAEEAKHLARDRAILFVVTSETEGYGSLAESGWAHHTAEKNGQKVFFVLEDYKDPVRGVEPKSPANRARKLVKAHAKEQGVEIYPSLESAVAAVEGYMKNQSGKVN